MTELAWFLSVGLIVLLIFGIPIAFTLALLTIVGLFIADINPIIFAQRVLAGTEVSSLVAIPGFILAGDLMGAGELAERQVRRGQATGTHQISGQDGERKSTRLNSSHVKISNAVLCFKKKNNT